MLRWSQIAALYTLLGALAFVAVAVWQGQPPWQHPTPWLSLAPRARLTYSVLGGLCFGGLVVVGTRFAVSRYTWARTLHGALRPLARGMSPAVIVAVALLSSLGEELLFRRLLQPWIGLVPQALVFGLAHQIPGPSRWVWAGWATAVGLVLGIMFQLTGSLLGPIVAHAVVNGLNLSYLKAHDPEGRRHLGGLLGQQPDS